MEKTASGLMYEIRKKTTGLIPRSGQTVFVHYMVASSYENLEDGPWLDSTYDRGSEFRFQVGNGEVINGIDEAIRLIRVLELYWLIIPPDLAFGKRGVPGIIPPNTTLYVALYLMSVMG